MSGVLKETEKCLPASISQEELDKLYNEQAIMQE